MNFDYIDKYFDGNSMDKIHHMDAAQFGLYLSGTISLHKIITEGT